MNSSTRQVLCVIPARYASTRLPGKPLLIVKGLPLVMWAYRRAVESEAFDSVCVATDDKRIFAAVGEHGGAAVMTSPTHRSGTDRCCEAALGYPCDHVVNLQGDEPDVPVSLLREFSRRLTLLDDNSLLTCATNATIKDKNDPHAVKVVTNSRGEALYFSRSAIPYDREGIGCPVLKHVGIYGFSKRGLAHFCRLPRGELERYENLEQLRALEHGMRVVCFVTEYATHGVDTPEDLREFRTAVDDVG